MFRHGPVSTEVDKGPFFFTLIAFLGSLTAALAFMFLAKGALAVFAAILLLIVAVAAAAVLFAIVTDQAYIRGETLTVRYLFSRKDIPLSEIGCVSLKDQEYVVYDRKNASLARINARLTGVDRVLNMLDKSGIRSV